MNDTEMSRYITENFKGVDVVVASGDSFFFYNPDPDIPPDHIFPWATLVTSDHNDPFSNLNRPSVYRLNMGVSKATVQSLFGELKPASKDERADQPVYSGFDYTALDQLMPHPVYGKMHWVSILNPADTTLETLVRPLLDEAYATAVTKFNKQHKA